MDTFKDLLAHLVAGETFSTEQAVRAFELVMDGQATPAQTGALLSLLATRQPTIDEIVGAATVMRLRAQRVTVPDGLEVIDTCGTGGDGTGTFNISTAAALVVAGAAHAHGIAVAKHGNRSVTSNSGSSQVLEHLGVKLQLDGPTLTQCLADVGLCFCFAPAHHPAMRHAGGIRGELGFRTIFNLLGPLTNPAGAQRQLIGVFSSRLTAPLAAALQRLGAVRAMVVHGNLPAADGKHIDGLDELSTAGLSQISELRDDGVRTYDLDAQALGLSYSHPSALRVDSPQASAATIRALLAGQHGPARDIVCLNAGAALQVAGLDDTLDAGMTRAAHAIDSGKAQRVLDKLVAVTQEQRLEARG